MAAGTGALLIAIGGGAAGISAMTSEKTSSRAVTAVGQAAAAEPAEPAEPDPEPPAGPAPAAKAQFGADAARLRTSNEADRTATRDPHRKAAPAVVVPAPVKAAVPAAAPPSAAGAGGTPVVTTRTEVETREIPFETRMVRDPSLPRGARQVQAPGVTGLQTLRYLVTLTDGQPTARRLLDATVTRSPQYQIVAFGDSYAPDPAPGPDRRRRHCGEALNFCVPLGRAAMCPAEQDRLLDEESAVTVQDSSLDVLPTGEGVC